MIFALSQETQDARSDEPALPSRRNPLRRCIASGEQHDKSELLRFVIGPDGAVVPDLAGELPGRGFWLLARRDMIDKACLRNLFAKAARAKVRVPDGLADQVTMLLRQRCLGLIGLARRAGVLTVGYEKVRSELSRGPAGVLIQASDGAPGGRHKLSALARATAPDMPVVEHLSAAELGQVIGREAAVHLVMAPGALADRFLVEVGRYAAVAAERPGNTMT